LTHTVDIALGERMLAVHLLVLMNAAARVVTVSDTICQSGKYDRELNMILHDELHWLVGLNTSLV